MVLVEAGRETRALSHECIERSVRPVAYRPALREDKAAVRTTTCMMSPAWGTPMPEKNVVKGDSFDE